VYSGNRNSTGQLCFTCIRLVMCEFSQYDLFLYFLYQEHFVHKENNLAQFSDTLCMFNTCSKVDCNLFQLLGIVGHKS
jgi:hypothetical protein